jgi:hypothetical protein
LYDCSSHPISCGYLNLTRSSARVGASALLLSLDAPSDILSPLIDSLLAIAISDSESPLAALAAAAALGSATGAAAACVVSRAPGRAAVATPTGSARLCTTLALLLMARAVPVSALLPAAGRCIQAALGAEATPTELPPVCSLLLLLEAAASETALRLVGSDETMWPRSSRATCIRLLIERAATVPDPLRLRVFEVGSIAASSSSLDSSHSA